MLHFIDLSLGDKTAAFIETLSAVAPGKAWFGSPGYPPPSLNDRRVGVLDVRSQLYRRAYGEIQTFLLDGLGQASPVDAVILDFSTEGEVFNERLGSRLHALARQTTERGASLILAQQNHNFERDYDRWCQASGQTPKVHFLHWHSWLVRSLLTLDNGMGQRMQAHVNQMISGDDRPFYFLNLNNTLRPQRLLCLLGLHANRLRDKGLVSFPALESTQRVDLDAVLHLFRCEYPGTVGLLQSNLPELERLLPLAADEARGDAWTLALDFDSANYRKSWFSLVTGSDFSSGEMRRFTEKLLKPIANLHPFVVFGNPDTLTLLHEWGFETFGDHFDESYDQETGKEARTEAVMCTMSKLCEPNLAQWRDLHRTMRPLLEANFQRLMGLSDRFRDEMAPAAISEVEKFMNARTWPRP